MSKDDQTNGTEDGAAQSWQLPVSVQELDLPEIPCRGTDPSAALAALLAMMASGNGSAGRECRLVIFTDGEPPATGRSSLAQIAARALEGELGGEVHSKPDSLDLVGPWFSDLDDAEISRLIGHPDGYLGSRDGLLDREPSGSMRGNDSGRAVSDNDENTVVGNPETVRPILDCWGLPERKARGGTDESK